MSFINPGLLGSATGFKNEYVKAIDRCYRIGQNKKVIAYRMICKDSVEEKIMKLQEHKKAVASDIITTDENVLKQLGKEDIMELFG